MKVALDTAINTSLWLFMIAGAMGELWACVVMLALTSVLTWVKVTWFGQKKED